MMTSARIADIRDTLAFIEPHGTEWAIDYQDGAWRISGTSGLIATLPDHAGRVAEAIALAPADLTDLLAEVDRLRGELESANDDANRYADRTLNLEWLLQHHGIAFPASDTPAEP